MTDHLDIDGLPPEENGPTLLGIFFSLTILVACFIASFPLQRGGSAR